MTVTGTITNHKLFYFCVCGSPSRDVVDVVTFALNPDTASVRLGCPVVRKAVCPQDPL